MKIRLVGITRLAALAALLAAPLARPQAKSHPPFGDPPLQVRTLTVAGKVTQPEELLREFLRQKPSSADARFLPGYALFRDEKPPALSRAFERIGAVQELLTGSEVRFRRFMAVRWQSLCG